MRGVVVVGLLALAIAAAGVAAANERPMAEAGLDQESTVNSTVYLDAGGSLDPDGEIAEYEWEIERPNGTTTVPDCPSCSLTQFVPMRAGQYNVTVTVTDDDGATMNDTMYVTVASPVFGPSTKSARMKSGGSSGGGGWSGGANADAVTYNQLSGNVWIDLAQGSNNVQLPGADRDPAEWGPDFNAWITDEEIDKLVDSGRAERYDNRIKVTGEAAEKLHSSLDPNRTREHEHAPARTHLRADQTADKVLDLDSEKAEKATNSVNTGNSVSEESPYSPPDQRAEGADTDTSDFENPMSDLSKPSESATEINDSHSYQYGPEGCTMATFC
jgi:hypothetical protein